MCSGSITVTNVHTIGFIFGQHEGMVRFVKVDYTVCIGSSKVDGTATLYDKYANLLLTHALLGNWYTFGCAFDAESDGAFRLVAIAPMEYANERSIFFIRP